MSGPYFQLPCMTRKKHMWGGYICWPEGLAYITTSHIISTCHTRWLRIKTNHFFNDLGHISTKIWYYDPYIENQQFIMTVLRIYGIFLTFRKTNLLFLYVSIYFLRAVTIRILLSPYRQHFYYSDRTVQLIYKRTENWFSKILS